MNCLKSWLTYDNYYGIITLKKLYAGVVKLADTLDLGSNAERCAGSSPVTRTRKTGSNVAGHFFRTCSSLEQNLNFQNVNKRTREVLKDQNRKQGITKQTSAKNAEIG